MSVRTINLYEFFCDRPDCQPCARITVEGHDLADAVGTLVQTGWTVDADKLRDGVADPRRVCDTCCPDCGKKEKEETG